MKKMLKTGMAVMLLVAAGMSVPADLLVSWENDGLTTELTTAADVVHPDLTSSVLSQQVRTTSAGWPDTLSAIQNDAAVTSLAAAITASDYFSFTITPDAGKSVNYSSLFLRYSIGANVRPAQSQFTLLSSKTGFTAADGLASFLSFEMLGATASGFGTGTFDLSGVTGLQGVSEAVEFRIYVHSVQGSMTRVAIGQLYGTNGTDDLVLSGTVIPEPATVGMLSLGALVACLVRRLKV